MNFVYMPELEWDYAYGAFWAVSLFFAFCIVLVFKKKRWM